MTREVETGLDGVVTLSNLKLSPEAQLNGVLSKLPEKDQLRFALAVPQAAKLMERLSVQVAESDRLSIVKDGLIVVIAAMYNKSTFACAHVNDIQAMADEVERVGREANSDPRTEGLFAGLSIKAIETYGSNAFDNIDLKQCPEGSFPCITMFNGRANFDVIRKVVAKGLALAYVVLVSDNLDGVMASPVVYGLTYRKGKIYGNES